MPQVRRLPVLLTSLVTIVSMGHAVPAFADPPAEGSAPAVEAPKATPPTPEPTAPTPAPVPAPQAAEPAQPAPVVEPATPATPSVAPEVPTARPTAPVVSQSEPVKKDEPSRWAGTSVTYRNLVSLPTLSPGYEQTWNPTYSNALLFLPAFRLTDRLSLRAWQYTTFELTNADDTTRNHEVQFSDTILTLAAKVYTNKAVGFSFGVSGNVALPTSKASQARTMYFGAGLGAAASLKRGPFSLSYSSRGTGNVYRSQIGEIEHPWVQQCAGLSEGCDPFVTNGRRNAQVTLLNIASFSWSPKEWLGFSAGAGMIHSFLHSQQVSQVPVATGMASVGVGADNADMRVLMYWSLGAEVQVAKGVGIGIGAETYNPQLTLASQYEAPFINRYTSFYLDLQLDPDKIFSSSH
jgi:hypothetical protein